MRTKKILFNMLSDILPYLLIGVVGLIKVKYLINYLGDANNGYYQFINQAIAYVFLAQVGFSEAVTYSLYKPFAEKNKDSINRIYSGAREIFKKIGYIILGIIILVSVGIYFYYSPNKAGETIPVILCFVIISTSYLISYFGKTQTYSAVLSANQDRYVYSLVLNIMKLICDILIIFVIVIFKSLVAIAILIFIIKIIEEIVIRLVVKRKYGWLKEIADKDTSMFKMTKDLAWMQVGHLVLNNVDSVLIMFFLGPIWVSIYTSYNFILRYLNEISSRINYAAVASFGNVFANNEDEKSYPLFKEFQSLFTIISFSMCLTFLLGIRCFVLNWIGDSNYVLDYITIVFFALTSFLNIIYYPLLSIINANGLFKENKRHIFLCALINVVLSLIMIGFYDINGVLFATIIAFTVNIFVKCKLIKNKTFQNVEFFEILKKYIYLICFFILCCHGIKFLEPHILNNIKGLAETVLFIIALFIIVTTIVITIMVCTDHNTRELFRRFKRLINGKKIKNT